MIMQTAGEKRLIQIFKTFVQKAIVPQIRKLEGSLVEWNKFSSLLFIDNPNYTDLQLFVESLPIWGSNNTDKIAPFNRKSELEPMEIPNFNPNKTFGGQRNKPNIFPLIDNQVSQSKQRDDSLRQRTSQNNNNIMTNLQRIMKNLQQNQSIIDSLGKNEIKTDFSPSIRLNSQNGQQYGGNQPSSQSYNYIPQNLNSINPNISLPSHSHSQPHLQPSHSTSLSYHKAYY